jgi:hypothetical protein
VVGLDDAGVRDEAVGINKRDAPLSKPITPLSSATVSRRTDMLS